MSHRGSDTDYLALFDATPDAMVILDAEGFVLDVNERLESLFGYPRDLLLGQSAAGRACPSGIMESESRPSIGTASSKDSRDWCLPGSTAA